MLVTRPVELPGAVRFTLRSEHVGDEFEIQVAGPQILVPKLAEGMPERLRVVYVLDGNLAFARARGAAQSFYDPDAPTEPVLIVGVGYPIGDDLARVGILRNRDLTPPGTPLTDELKEYVGDAEVGGADRFLRFLEDELDPIIRREFPAADGRAGLFGTSFGGLCALYALFTRSPLFDRYIVTSPGSIFPDELALNYEQQCWDQSRTLDAKLFLALGGLERTSAIDSLRHIAVNYDKLTERLAARTYDQFEWTSREYDGETHTSYSTHAFSHALRQLYPGRSPLAPDATSNVEGLS